MTYSSSVLQGTAHAYENSLRKKDSSVMVSMWRRGSKDPFISQPTWGLMETLPT